MTDQTREVIRQRRVELTDEQRAMGWDYTYYTTPDAIIGVYVTPDGEFVGDDEVLEWYEPSERC